ncbi:hypothetical protein HID58_018138 [Brassica napus]|uniref:Uncharacterized protein n=1 Tax=Brassica napus TaxID=3708 RepID=A0ABQ8DA92_BRANA|nr:hypothetical protein HID58_018138 [Brassica napus]
MGKFLIMLDVWCYYRIYEKKLEGRLSFSPFWQIASSFYLLYSHYRIRQNPYSTLELLSVSFITS